MAIFVSPGTNPNGSQLIAEDTSIFLGVNNSHIQSLNLPMILLAEYGREVVWTAAITLLLVFGGWTGKKAGVVMMLAILVLIPVGYGVKEVVHRLRPIVPQADFLIPSDSAYSFPSGHALIVAAGAVAVLALFRDSKRKLAISLGLTAEAALVCISRVYVGAHYPLDVVGGVLLGAGISLIFIGSAERIEKMIGSDVIEMRSRNINSKQKK